MRIQSNRGSDIAGTVENSVRSPNVTIGEGARISYSVLFPGVTVEPGAGARAGLGQRQGAQGEGPAAGRQVRAPGGPAHQHQRQRLVHGAAGLQHLRGQLGEGGAGHVPVDAEAVEGRAGVRGGPLHDTGLVELDHAVAHPGRAAGRRDRGARAGGRPRVAPVQQSPAAGGRAGVAAQAGRRALWTAAIPPVRLVTLQRSQPLDSMVRVRAA